MAYIDLQSRTSSTLSVYMSNISDINKLYEDYENNYDMSGFSFVLDWYISAPITDYNLSVGSYYGTWEKVGSQQYSYYEFQDLVYDASGTNKTDVFNIVDLPPQSKMFIRCVVYVGNSDGKLNKYAYRNSGMSNSEYYESVFKAEYWTDEAPINFSSRKPDSISVYISNLDTSYDGIGRKVTWIVNDVEVGEQSIPNQINQTTPYEITGLEPGKKYSITYKMLSANKYTSCDLTPVEYWTAAAPYIQFMSSDETSITARIVINDGSYYNSILSNPKIKWYYSTNPSTFSGSADYIDTSYSTTNGVVTFSNLVSSTRYYFKCEILSSNESQSYYTTTETRLSDGNTPSDGFMTTDTGGGGIDPTKPYINYISCTNSSITVNVTNMAKVYKDPYVVFVHYSTDSEFTNYNKVAHNLGLSESVQGYTNNITISGLAPNTTYYLKCDVYMEGQYMYTSGNYITVTTADQNGDGGGLGTGGSGGGGGVVVDPAKPVIKIIKRDNELIYVQLTNITTTSSKRYIHWFLSTSTPVSLTNYDEYEFQELPANSTESEIKDIIVQHSNVTYYIYCLITSSANAPTSKNDSTVLESGIVTVESKGSGGSGAAYEIVSGYTDGAIFHYTYNEDIPCGYLDFGITLVTEDFPEMLWANVYIDKVSDSHLLGYQMVEYDLSIYLDSIYVNNKYCDGNIHTLIIEVGTGYDYDSKVLATAEEDVLLYNNKSNIDVFSWTTNIQTGATVRFDITSNQFRPITADEWNEFCTKVNDVRIAKGLTSYAFTKVSTGTIFTKAIYNEAVSALNDMLSGASLLEEASSVNVVNAIAASTYLTLSDRLNSLINNL